VAFLGFAWWTWRGSDDDDDDDIVTAGRRSVLASIVTAMVVAELGDKTMLATATLAAREAPFWTWIGATAGITASGAVAVAVGTLLGDRLPRRATRLGAAMLFALFGVLLLVDAAR
jgi:Ca2+/H+ antiporter, TMEM165/GDT1 family